MDMTIDIIENKITDTDMNIRSSVLLITYIGVQLLLNVKNYLGIKAKNLQIKNINKGGEKYENFANHYVNAYIPYVHLII